MGGSLQFDHFRNQMFGFSAFYRFVFVFWGLIGSGFLLEHGQLVIAQYASVKDNGSSKLKVHVTTATSHWCI